MKEVIIKVYVESSRVVFPYYKKDKGRKTKKIKPYGYGYDRRAQLLAYAQNLRHGHNYEWPFNSKHHYYSASRKKIRRLPWAEYLSQICLFCHKFLRLQNKERYYRGSYKEIVTEDYMFSDRLITASHNTAKTRTKQGKLKIFIKHFATCCWKCHGSANVN